MLSVVCPGAGQFHDMEVEENLDEFLDRNEVVPDQSADGHLSNLSPQQLTKEVTEALAALSQETVENPSEYLDQYELIPDLSADGDLSNVSPKKLKKDVNLALAASPLKEDGKNYFKVANVISERLYIPTATTDGYDDHTYTRRFINELYTEEEKVEFKKAGKKNKLGRKRKVTLTEVPKKTPPILPTHITWDELEKALNQNKNIKLPIPALPRQANKNIKLPQQTSTRKLNEPLQDSVENVPISSYATEVNANCILPDCYYSIHSEVKEVRMGNKDGYSDTLNALTHTLCREDVPPIIHSSCNASCNNGDRISHYKKVVRHLKRKYKATKSLISSLDEANQSLASVIPDHISIDNSKIDQTE